jgi:hypothetical protein
VVITGTITDVDGGYRHLEGVGKTYEEAREHLYALLEEGQKLIAIRTDR